MKCSYDYLGVSLVAGVFAMLAYIGWVDGTDRALPLAVILGSVSAVSFLASCVMGFMGR